MNADRLNSTLRPAALRLHPDIVVSQQTLGETDVFVLKQPWNGKYFQLRPEEWFLLSNLGPGATLTELQREYQQHFAPRRITQGEILRFLNGVQTNGLVVSDQAGQGATLRRQHQRKRSLQWLSAPAQLLSLRLPAWNAEPLLKLLDPLARWLFHPCMAACIAGLCLIAAGMAFTLSDELLQRMPTANAFLRADNLLLLTAIVLSVKVVHELAHALACRHFGAECREIGVLFLVFIPVLYCDTSDAWMLPSRRQRMIVSAAGMYVELCIAGVATFLWWFSEPGLANSVFFNLMFVCSINTLLFNGNPLLRFDGYYILADLLNVPNLSQQASEALWTPARNWLLQTHQVLNLDASRGTLVTYGVLALAYRTFVVAAILWAVYAALKHYHAEPIADLIVAGTLGGLILFPVYHLITWSQNPMVRPTLGRRLLAACGCAACVSLIGLVPFPKTVSAPARIEVADATYVYAAVPGTLVTCVDDGVSVNENEVIVTLRDHDRERSQTRLQGTVRALEKRLTNLQRRKHFDAQARNTIAATQQTLRALRAQLQAVERDLEHLTIRAARAGQLIHVARAVAPAEDPKSNEGRVEPPPLDGRQRGSFVERGELLAVIGSPGRRQAIAQTDQSQADLLTPGTRVMLRLDQHAQRRFSGTVAQIASSESRRGPALRPGSTNPNEASEVLTEYAVQITFDDEIPRVPHGAWAKARFVVHPASLWQRARDALYETFRFTL